MIGKEMLEARLFDLQQQKQKALLTLASVDGAIQDCEFWIASLSQMEKKGFSPEEIAGMLGGQLAGVELKDSKSLGNSGESHAPDD